MSIITLTTDFGYKDYSVGALKGILLSVINDVKIVDISHQITPFNISEAAYVLKNSYPKFPKESIHIIGVDAEYHKENIYLAALLNEHFFICANNGVMSLLCDDLQKIEVVKVRIEDEKQVCFYKTFARVASEISKNKTLKNIGIPIKTIKKIKTIQPIITGDRLIGQIVYIDNYGNSISNITKELFEKTRGERNFEIGINQQSLKKIYKNYSDIIHFDQAEDKRNNLDGTALAIFNSAGYLEIALYKSNLKTTGGASTLLGLTVNQPIDIFFKDTN